MPTAIETNLKPCDRRWSRVVAENLAVAGAVTVYTQPFYIGGEADAGIWFKAESGGIVALGISIEYAPLNDVPAHFAELEGGSPIMAALADQVPHNDSVLFKRSNWARLKIVGGALNAASTTLTAVVNMGSHDLRA
jgi:hypothetical protein